MMNIQTLSIVVPTKGCVNNCPFCVSRMHENNYHDKKVDMFSLKKRIKWAIMNGINTCVITGTGEALQNYHFLGRLADLFDEMSHPFPNVEFQTTGVMLMDYEESGAISSKDGAYRPVRHYHGINILKELGVNTVSLSVSDVFDDVRNNEIIGTKEKTKIELAALITLLKSYNFNVRLSLNMLKHYNLRSPEEILTRCKELGADQVTFRKMYSSEDKDSPESAWVAANSCSEMKIREIIQYVAGGSDFIDPRVKTVGHGKYLYTLPFGAKVYSILGMSTVVDDDCMSKNNDEALKYAILRENGKLYARWDDEGSLIF